MNRTNKKKRKITNDRVKNGSNPEKCMNIISCRFNSLLFGGSGLTLESVAIGRIRWLSRAASSDVHSRLTILYVQSESTLPLPQLNLSVIRNDTNICMDLRGTYRNAF